MSIEFKVTLANGCFFIVAVDDCNTINHGFSKATTEALTITTHELHSIEFWCRLPR
jgi:hypothetical protein